MNSLKLFFQKFIQSYYFRTLVLIILGFFTYGIVLTFTFWKDDWIHYWGALNNYPRFYAYWFHPGTTIEFILLSKLFHQQMFIWQVDGIIFRIFAALGVGYMVEKITKRRDAGWFAAISFVSSVIGLDSVGWVSAHVVNLLLFFICLAFGFWIKFLEKRNKIDLLISLCFLIIGIFVDPWRGIPIIVFYYLYVMLFTGKETLALKQWSNRIILLLIFIAPIFILWQWTRIQDTVFYSFISKHYTNPEIIVKKIYVVGNYFSTVGNIFIGWCIRMPEYLSTGEYNKVLARLMLIPFFTTIIFLYHGIRKNNKFLLRISFFFTWVFIFYLPNWLSEPRLTMGVTHRYVVVASVGFIAFVSYLISLIPNKYIRIIALWFFVFSNIWMTHDYLHQWQEFRSRIVLNNIWNRVKLDVKTGNDPNIFIFTGDHPAIINALHYSGGTPYGVNIGIIDPYYFPIMTDDIASMVPYFCTDGVSRNVLAIPTSQKNKFTLDQIYAWNIQANGTMKNTSMIQRKKMMQLLKQNNCL